MGLRTYARQFEKTVLRPIPRFFFSGRREKKLDRERIAVLEQKVKVLEALVREDLGLRYLGLERIDPTNDSSSS